MKRILWNQRGEGLISVLISVAILGVLIVTMVTMYQMFGTMMAKSLLRREADVLAQRIRGVLAHRNLCKQALVPNTWDGAGEANITVWDTGGVAMATEGMTIANGRLRMKKVYLRPYRIDADGDGSLTNNNLVTDVHVKVGNDGARARSGEVVIWFELASDAVGSGDIAERRAPVVVLVDPSNNHIKDCDLNEETVKAGGGAPCTGGEPDANADGNSCPLPPAPYKAEECQKVSFVMSVDAFGEPKCGCSWSCVTPYYRNIKQSAGVCSSSLAIATGNTPCPAVTISGGKGYCAGKSGEKCYWRAFDWGCYGANWRRPYAQFFATCLKPPHI